MSLRTKYRKPVAAFMLAIVASQTLLPATALALTSGPVQPEVSTFKPAGVTDMVDMFTGNFSYNLPLLDIDGYPINLSYQAGMGNDEEASWAGFGWNVNIGSITRQVRGVPDDFSGDLYATHQYNKPNITVGGKVSGKTELAGIPLGLGKGKATGSLSLSIFSNNYTGVGAELGANAGLSWIGPVSGLTANMGADLQSSTSSGVSVQRKFSIEQNFQINEDLAAAPGISGSDSWNSRGGLKERTLGFTLSVNGSAAYDIYGTSTSFNTPPINPRIKIPYKSVQSTVTFDTGPSAWFIFTGGGITGYKVVNDVKDNDMHTPAFGFLYADRGKNRTDAMMDMLREKENPIIPELPNLAVPVATPDLFSYTSQVGSGQFRLYRGGAGILFDNEAIDENIVQTAGFDAGGGVSLHGGVNLFNQVNNNKGGKWVLNNAFMSRADFQSPSDRPNDEHVFFKQVGDMSKEDEALVNTMQGTEPVAVNLHGHDALSQWRTATGTVNINSNILKTSKEKKRTAISYLTAEEASKFGLDKQLKSYKANTDGNMTLTKMCSPETTPAPLRVDGTIRKKNHISEITVTDENGKRNVYGIPVYNKSQVDVTYAIGKKNGTGGYVPDNNNLVTVTPESGRPRQSKHADNDNYLHTETQPAYASSYLLSGILSPDYVDVTGDGITADDLGTAIKFNYTYVGDQVWRTPFGIGGANKATVSRGLLADPDDDKGSLVYGEKELWFPHSIETKTKIAYFITENRFDAMGVANWTAAGPGGVSQKRLKEIWLYSKADPSRPIKIVKLTHDYSLCSGAPNSLVSPVNPTAGKLTLTQVEFLYGNSPKGANHPYKFEYKLDAGGPQVGYDFLQTDRWGTYKPREANAASNIPFKNDEYPYTIQKPETDAYAGLWQLKQIELPTGGVINVSYESDSYSYVQNRKAMELVKVTGLIGDAGQTVTDLTSARGVRVKIKDPVSITDTKDFINKYLNGSSYIYTKLFVNVGGLDAKTNPTNDAYYDFVPCYAKIAGVESESGGYFKLKFELMTEGDIEIDMNPIQQAAYQKLKLEYPRYAYPGYKNRVSVSNVGSAIQAAATAIGSAAKNLKELSRNFYEIARHHGFANHVNLDKSFVRLAKLDEPKRGGGHRVKKIMISDNWATMSGNSENLTRTYGQEYQYQNGVASNEPSIGSDENPLRMPVPYMQYIKKGLDNFYNLEEPFGEYYFPAPTVGYGMVTVRDLGENGIPDPANRTGSVVNEFYTAKDFPVITRVLTNKLNQHGPKGWYSFFGGSSVHEMIFSQGYSIELNDMHGKPKAVRVLNKGGTEISSSEYKYRSELINADEWKLKNEVQVIDEFGQVEDNKVIGREIELFTDMRQQESSTIGQNVMLGMDLVYAIVFGGPFPHFPYKRNDDYRLFRSACTMKVINRYGIVEKVIKKEDGAVIEAANLVFDAVTGQPVVTRSQNEFKDPVYTINFPAYWVHKGMGGAYKNIGTVLPGFTTTATGAIEKAVYAEFLQPGDELISLSSTGAFDRFWVIESAVNNAPSGATKKLVDRAGKVIPNMAGQEVKVIRSGYRNVLGAAAASMVCLKDPVSQHADPVTGKKYLVLSKNEEQAAWKVLTASAANYDDYWSTGPECLECLPGYELNKDGLCQKLPNENTNACFALVRGSVGSHYGIQGASIYQTNTSTPVPRKSFFWGGACKCPTGTNLVQPNIQTVNATQSLVTPAATPTCEGHTSPNLDNCNEEICGRLVKSGIWLYNPDNVDLGWIGVEFCVEVPEPGTYYVGFAADQKMVMKINGTEWNQSIGNSYASNYEYWQVRPYEFPQKKNTVLIEFASESAMHAAGFEVYGVSYQELIAQNLNLTTKEEIIFSTARDLLGKRVQVHRNYNGARVSRYYCAGSSTPYTPCEECGTYALDRVVNPYVKGVKGNWRTNETKVFQVDRNHDGLFNEQKKGADIRTSGAFASFKPFWYLEGKNWKPNTAIQNWVTANTVTLYDKYGQERENLDALDRYSAASFAFAGQLPNAVASNARSREVIYESFEDAKFDPCTLPKDRSHCYQVSFKNGAGDLKPDITNVAHTGNYAYMLKADGLKLDTREHREESKKWPYLFTNNKGEFTLTPEPTVFPLGFEPVPGKKYVFSAWVKENQPAVNTTLPITLSMNGVNQELKRKAYVEKWSLVEGTFTVPELLHADKANAAFSLVINTVGGNRAIDDIRIQPFDALVKSYAYDDKTLRLMAEMDENSFATFYEYDNEGGLVRVKKETERGILTIKESRTSQTKKNP